MKYCIECAEKLEDTAKFCYACGAKQSFEEQPAHDTGDQLKNQSRLETLFVILPLVIGIAFAVWPPAGSHYGFFFRLLIFLFSTVFSWIGAFAGLEFAKNKNNKVIVGFIVALIGACVGGKIGSAIIIFIRDLLYRLFT